MKLPSIIPLLVALTSAAPSPAGPYTDPKSGITFSAFSDSATGYFFGLALPPNTTERDFIATLGGKGTGWSGVSLGGAMLNKLLIVAWPNGQEIVSSFRKTAYVFLSPFSCLWHSISPLRWVLAPCRLPSSNPRIPRPNMSNNFFCKHPNNR